MGFSRQGYGVGCHFLLQGNLPDPGIEPGSPTLQADALPSEPPGKITSNMAEETGFKVSLENIRKSVVDSC